MTSTVETVWLLAVTLCVVGEVFFLSFRRLFASAGVLIALRALSAVLCSTGDALCLGRL
jgi:hypothetical protein